MLKSNLVNLNEELGLELKLRYLEISMIKLIYNDNISLQRKISNFYKVELNNKSRFILRNGILSLYSHWEGYFKFCLQLINIIFIFFKICFFKIIYI